MDFSLTRGPINDPLMNGQMEQSGVPPTKNTDNATTASKPARKKTFFIILILVLVLLSVGTASASMLIAYNKIKIANPQLKNLLTNTIQSIPFMPKTPDYILAKSGEAHAATTSANVTLSISLQSDKPNPVFEQLTSFDMLIKGPFYFAGSADPKSHLTILMGKDLDMEVITLGKDVYIKINKVPLFLNSILGPYYNIDFEKFTNQWVYMDAKPLDSEARESLEEKEGKDKELDVYMKILEELGSEEINPKLKMATENLVDRENYKISSSLTADEINLIFKKISEAENNTYASNFSNVFESLTIDIWIDKQTYYVNKFILKSELDLSKSQTSNADLMVPLNPTALVPGKLQMALAFIMTEHGKDFQVSPPSEFITMEDFIKNVMSNLTPSVDSEGNFDSQNNFDLDKNLEELKSMPKENENDSGTPFGKLL